MLTLQHNDKQIFYWSGKSPKIAVTQRKPRQQIWFELNPHRTNFLFIWRNWFLWPTFHQLLLFNSFLYILTSCFFKAWKSWDMFVKSTCLSCLASQSLGIWGSLTDCQLARLITSLIFSFQPLFPPSRNSVIDSVHKLDFPGSVNHQVAPRASK